MITLVKQELFKISKKRSTLVLSILLVIFMIALAVMGKNYPDYFSGSGLFLDKFGAPGVITFIMIAAASVTIAQEFQYGTIKNLLYRRYSRTEILFSKWLALLIYSLYLYVLSLVVSLILKFALFSNVELGAAFNPNSGSVWQVTLLSSLAQFTGLWLIVSLVLLLACLFNSSGAAISAGLIFYFATNIVSNIMTGLISRYEWLKWNPLNMLNLNYQVVDSTGYIQQITKLSNAQMWTGVLVYIAVFLALGLFAFRKKSV